MINKRFPADTSLQKETFLLNKKIDGELYALFQSYSKPNSNGDTVVKKKDLPTLTELGKILSLCDDTVGTHRKALIKAGYIIDDKANKQYILPNLEDIYILIPLHTLQYLNDNLREHVIKIYVYLGQRWKYKGSNYIFTIQEIADHIGIKLDNNQRNYNKINNALYVLRDAGLINWEDTYTIKQEKTIPQKRLTNFSLNYIPDHKRWEN